MIRALLIACLLLFAASAEAQIALDTTAHPAGAMITNQLQNNATTGVLTSPSFSSAAANRLLNVVVGSAGNGQITNPGSLSGAGLTWTRKLGFTFIGADAGVAQVEIFQAYATTILSTVTVTWTPANPPTPITGFQSALMNVYVLSGAAQTQAGVGTGTYQNDTAVNDVIAVNVTASASGSWIIAGFLQADNNGGMGTPNAATTPFDTLSQDFTSDSFGNGRLKTPATTTATTVYTVGCGIVGQAPFGIGAGIEVLAGGPDPLSGSTGGMMGFF